MKYITSALVLLALIGSQEQVNAIKVNQKAAFTDDLVKSLAEEMQKDASEEDSTAAPVEEKKPAPAPKAAPKAAAKPVAAAQ